MAEQWLRIDTRDLGKNRDSKFDGFLHLIPKKNVRLHMVDTSCWCEPTLLWPENGDTLIVSHRNVCKEK